MHSSFGVGLAIGLIVGQTQMAPVRAQAVAQRGADRTGGAGDQDAVGGGVDHGLAPHSRVTAREAEADGSMGHRFVAGVTGTSQ